MKLIVCMFFSVTSEFLAYSSRGGQDKRRKELCGEESLTLYMAQCRAEDALSVRGVLFAQSGLRSGWSRSTAGNYNSCSLDVGCATGVNLQN